MPIGALYRADGVEDDYYAGGERESDGGEREGVEGTAGEARVDGAAGLSPSLGSIPSSFPRAPHQERSAAPQLLFIEPPPAPSRELALRPTEGRPGAPQPILRPQTPRGRRRRWRCARSCVGKRKGICPDVFV